MQVECTYLPHFIRKANGWLWPLNSNFILSDIDNIKSFNLGKPSSFKSKGKGSFFLRYRGNYAKDIPVFDSANISTRAFLTTYSLA